jgi:hypothetical protein
MHREAIDRRAELVDSIDPTLLGAPVESFGPMCEQVLQVFEVGSLDPGRAGRRRRPARREDAPPKIAEQRVVDIDEEGLGEHCRILPRLAQRGGRLECEHGSSDAAR